MACLGERLPVAEQAATARVAAVKARLPAAMAYRERGRFA
jgi:hypothetical protein